MLYLRRLVPILLLCHLVLPLGAQASGPRPVITISIGEQPPLLSEKGGIVDVVIREALRRGGYTPVYRWFPIGRMLAFLEADTLDFYVTPSNTPGQHNPHVDFLAARGVFFHLKKNASATPIRPLEDLAGKRVGTVTNSPLRAMFEKAGIIVDEGPFESMFLKLEAGRVDYVSTADVGGILTIAQLFPQRIADFDYTDLSYATISVGLYTKPSPEGDKILAAARAGFAAIKADGTLSRMLVDFFGPAYAPRVKVY